MQTRPQRHAANRAPILTLARAFGRAWWTRRPLPPGDLVALDILERADRTLLIDRAATHGPIFKGLLENRLAVCVVGHSLGRRLLKEHAAALRPVSIDIEPMVRNGFMRQMAGDTHRRYRAALVRGVNAIDFESLAPHLEAVVSAHLAAHASLAGADVTPLAWAETLSRIAGGLLVAVILGADPRTATFDALNAGYRHLGPHGVVWHPAARQVEAFQTLRGLLAEPSTAADAALPGALLPALVRDGSLDDTLLGNLIYMVELGRYDLRGLLRWISRHAGEHSTWLDRIADEPAAGGAGEPSAARAFVLETLRMDQSERLMRDVLRDVEFEGFLIPRGTLLRVCMWEAHKDATTFAQPFSFDPGRFLGDTPAGEQFSPFGLDHHHCPLAGATVHMACTFLRTLARGYTLSTRGGDPAVRGPYHWEPDPDFVVSLTPRSSGPP